MKKLRLGIIGIGNMGSGHAKNIKEGKYSNIENAAKFADTSAVMGSTKS